MQTYFMEFDTQVKYITSITISTKQLLHKLNTSYQKLIMTIYTKPATKLPVVLRMLQRSGNEASLVLGESNGGVWEGEGCRGVACVLMGGRVQCTPQTTPWIRKPLLISTLDHVSLSYYYQEEGRVGRKRGGEGPWEGEFLKPWNELIRGKGRTGSC